MVLSHQVQAGAARVMRCRGRALLWGTGRGCGYRQVFTGPEKAAILHLAAPLFGKT